MAQTDVSLVVVAVIDVRSAFEIAIVANKNTNNSYFFLHTGHKFDLFYPLSTVT